MLDQLWRKIYRRTNSLRLQIGLALQNLRQPEIPQFHRIILRHKNIFQFDIPMDYLVFMKMLHGRTEYLKQHPKLILFVFHERLSALLDDLCEVTFLCVLHYDVEVINRQE